MVAKAGTGWKLTPSLIACVDEADRLWPGRNQASDGSIGDAAHQATRSDHNPNPGGWVTALDLTHDPDVGLDIHAWADELRRRRDHRVKYVISAGRIFASYHRDWRDAWAWGPYNGANAHTRHAHVSVLDTPTGRGLTAPWFAAGGAPGTPARVPQLQIPDRPYPGVIGPGDGMPPQPPSPAVKVWQQALAERGYQLVVDGRFGRHTEATVRNFQARARIPIDGIAGPATWHNLLFFG
ncbi:MAG TPA: peptidoglycan-binding domain-containing protein [Methylomirabilota bacterium]|jgi:peptidoglycan hydrolase-like protein with peptidoglycan-binding domain|nr:peptidoglycan-binding domain-containing protein [Methylomirabilota bacterium]